MMDLTKIVDDVTFLKSALSTTDFSLRQYGLIAGLLQSSYSSPTLLDCGSHSEPMLRLSGISNLKRKSLKFLLDSTAASINQCKAHILCPRKRTAVAAARVLAIVM